jgi:DNA-binding CsgD family transcriptional regulator
MMLTSSEATCIATLGTPNFHEAFRQYLLSVCGADFFALYHGADGQLDDIIAGGLTRGGIASQQAKLYVDGGFWRHDPGLDKLWTASPRGRPIIVHLEIDGLENEEMRERIYRPYLVREKVVVSGRDDRSAVAISLMRTDRKGPFGADTLAALANASEAIVALAMKHVTLTRECSDPRLALTYLPTIEACLAHTTPALSRREAEVCARVLYGMTSMGISLDIGVSEESAMTYRKRAYARLGIGSQRELLLWYLDQWSQHRAVGEALV